MKANGNLIEINNRARVLLGLCVCTQRASEKQTAAVIRWVNAGQATGKYGKRVILFI